MRRLAVAAVVSVVLTATLATPADAMTRAPGDVNGYPCGGTLPPCSVLRRESRGNPTAQNHHSTASGLWQFVDRTWAHHGGYRHARQAPWQVQNDRARIVWAGGRGCRHWGRAACR